MTRHVRALVLILALGLTAFVSSTLTSIQDRDSRSGPLPALIDGLPGTVADARQQFAERVKARFPLGSPERVLMLDLWRQGFEHPGEQGTRRWTIFESRTIACISNWTVTWAVDENDRLTAVDGEFVPSCL